MSAIVCPYCNTIAVKIGDYLRDILPCHHLLMAIEDVSETLAIDKLKEVKNEIPKWERGISENITFEDTVDSYVYITHTDNVLGEIVTLYKDLIENILQGYIDHYISINNYQLIKRYIIEENNFEQTTSFSIWCQIFYFFSTPDEVKQDIKEHFYLISMIEIPISVNVIIQIKQLIDKIKKERNETKDNNSPIINEAINDLISLYPKFSIDNTYDIIPQAIYIQELWKLKRIEENLYLLTKDIYKRYKNLKQKIPLMHWPSKGNLILLKNEVNDALITMRRIIEDCMEVVINLNPAIRL